MGHVDHQVRINLIRNLPHAREVNAARNGRAASDDHLWSMLLCWNLKARCDRFLYLSSFISSLKASVGVRHPKHFLGVMFMRSQIDFTSRFESAATGASRRKYRLARLFRFPTEPFRQGACGSQNQASVPIPGLSLRQFLNSIPRSNVIDLRAG